MCEVSSIKTRRRVGYKVMAIDGDGNFYSTFTGQKMGIGKVPDPPLEICQRLSNYWNSGLDVKPLHHCRFYGHRFKGKTSAFINIRHANSLFNEFIQWDWFNSKFTLVLVKIKLGGEVYKGTYHTNETIVSDTIESITVIKKDTI